MTNKKDNSTKEVEGEKSEKSENIVVHIDKDGADEVKKLKATLTKKKRVQQRDILINSRSKLQHLQMPLMFTTETILQPLKLH